MDDAPNADLRRFRRVEIVRRQGRLLARIRNESLASCHSVLPILLPPLTAETTSNERIRQRLKVFIMSFRPTTLVVLTTGLIAAAGLIGCQVPRQTRSFEFGSPWWRRTSEPRTQPKHKREFDSQESYLPESPYAPDSIPDQPNLRLPPEPTIPSQPSLELRPIPVPPATEIDQPHARRWKPSQPATQTSREPQYTRQSEASLEQFDLPPARVTYNTDEPESAPSPEYNNISQPKLFRPAGSAKSMFDTMKRKLSR